MILGSFHVKAKMKIKKATAKVASHNPYCIINSLKKGRMLSIICSITFPFLADWKIENPEHCECSGFVFLSKNYTTSSKVQLISVCLLVTVFDHFGQTTLIKSPFSYSRKKNAVTPPCDVKKRSKSTALLLGSGEHSTWSHILLHYCSCLFSSNGLH